MRYIAGLIPDAYKVRRDYFKSSAESSRQFSPKAKTISYLTAGLFFLFALAHLMHPPLFLLATALGLGLLPSVHRWLERKGRFDFTPVIKRTLYAFMLLPIGLMTGYFSKADAKLAHEHLLQQQEAKRQAVIASAKDSIRRDSLYTNLSLLKHQQEKGILSEMQVQLVLNHLDSLAIQPEEKRDISDTRFIIAKDNTLKLVRSGKYRPAVDALTSLLLQSPEDATLLYNRALCYDKLGAQEAAIQDLRLAMKAGNTTAETYHDKINPVRKRIVGYITRCCDGTTSNAKGRGACSWHGGVCNWNEPEYETYRKYQ
jgi:tetratricopeptide (TPR) repeat protein